MHNHAVAWSSGKEYGSLQVHHFPAVLPLRLSVPRTSYNQGSCRDTQKSQALFLWTFHRCHARCLNSISVHGLFSRQPRPVKILTGLFFFELRSPTAKRSYASLFRFIKLPFLICFLLCVILCIIFLRKRRRKRTQWKRNLKASLKGKYKIRFKCEAE